MNTNCSTALPPLTSPSIRENFLDLLADLGLRKRRHPAARSTDYILSLLRAQQGPVRAPAGSGKTTALLAYARELALDGSAVLVVTRHPNEALRTYRRLFPHSCGLDIRMADHPQKVQSTDALILVDEPNRLSRSARIALRHLCLSGSVLEGAIANCVYNGKTFLRY